MSDPLMGLAYRMLGSVADAEEVVQEARLRLHQRDTPPDDEGAFLFRVVANLAVDRLRHERVERERYPGPWLPEPLPTNEEIVATAEELSLGFMLLLERLSPAERVVFVLREGFDLSYGEIARLLGVQADACRQRLRRAKAHLAGEARFATPPDEQRRLLERLVQAVADRDAERLAALFREDAVVLTDGGGVVNAAVRPLTGPKRIAQVTLFLLARQEAEGVVTVEPVTINRGAGFTVALDGVVNTVFTVEGEGGLITRLYAIRNPVKLDGFLRADRQGR